MTGEAENRGNEARWAELLEAEANAELSEAERRELDRLEAESEERRQVRRVLASIATRVGSEPDIAADDGRLIDAVLGRHAQVGRRRKRVLWLATAAVLVPLAAAAAYLPWVAREDAALDEDAPATAPRPEASSVILPHSRREDRSDQEREVKSEAASQPDAASGAPAVSATTPPSAAELLARAQKARSGRRYGAAIRTYQQLLRRHPRSGEARVAQVSLAQLQLTQGHAAAALAGFDAYLRSGGALSPEAHYGKIQALRALGRTGDERAEIRRFLARYPKSLQAAALRRRAGVQSDQD